MAWMTRSKGFSPDRFCDVVWGRGIGRYLVSHSHFILLLIISVTKFSIEISSPHVYLSRNQYDHMGIQLQVSNLNVL